MIGDWLYALTPRDEQQTPLQLVRAFNTLQGATMSLRARYVPPRDFCLLLDGIHYTASPGSAQNVVSLLVRLLDSQNANLPLFTFDFVPGAGANVVVTRSIFVNKIAIDGRHDMLEFFAIFNSGTNANAMDVALIGTLIPVGNMAPARLAPSFTVP